MKFVPYEELVDLKPYLSFSKEIGGYFTAVSIVEFFSVNGARHLMVTRFDNPSTFETDLLACHIDSYGSQWLCRKLI